MEMLVAFELLFSLGSGFCLQSKSPLCTGSCAAAFMRHDWSPFADFQ
jgi:hypothetical protein